MGIVNEGTKNASRSGNVEPFVTNCHRKRCFASIVLSRGIVLFPSQSVILKTESISSERFKMRVYPLLWFKLYGLKISPEMSLVYV